jgi:N-methylhydantoinase A
VHFAETGWVDCPIIDRSTLLEGQIVTAPAVIEDRESTVVLPPGAKAELDNDCLVIEVSTA